MSHRRMLTNIQRSLISRRATFFHQGSAFGVPYRPISADDSPQSELEDEPPSDKEMEQKTGPQLVR